MGGVYFFQPPSRELGDNETYMLILIFLKQSWFWTINFKSLGNLIAFRKGYNEVYD